MKTITITGEDKQIYNILRENKIRFKRHKMEVTGDTNFEKPSITLANNASKDELSELRKEAKKLKIIGFNMMKEEKLKIRIAEAKVKQKEDKGAASRKTKEEKKKFKTK